MLLKKTATDLDATDYEIMSIMQEDARITMRELAQRIALSPPSTAERVRRLEEGGFIEGYQATLDPSKLGYTTHAYILIGTIRADKVRQFYREMQEIPEIVSVEKLYTGGYHCILNVFCQNTEQLDAVQTRLIDLGYAEQTTLLCSPQKEKQAGFDLQIDDSQ